MVCMAILVLFFVVLLAFYCRLHQNYFPVVSCAIKLNIHFMTSAFKMSKIDGGASSSGNNQPTASHQQLITDLGKYFFSPMIFH